MWVIARAVVVWLFGDDLVKYALYVVAGFLVLVFVEASAATAAIMAQPFGQWWLAGVAGGAAPTAMAPVSAPLPGPLAAPVPTLAAAPSVALDRTSAILTNALSWLGVRYLFSGCTRAGVDCSCFLQNVLRASGIGGVPRNTLGQIAWTHPVSRAQLQPTDFIYFDDTCDNCGGNPTHVAMYLGDHKMIHAGDPVQIVSIDTPYWRAHWDSAGRIP